MNRLASACLVVLLCLVAYAQTQQSEQISGRYFTADTLLSQLQSPATERSAQLYLMGAYDLTQDSGQSCAVRGTTTPVQLVKVFSNYLRAHSELMHADRTAAGVAAQAFAEFWPCQKQQSQPSPQAKPTAQSQPSPPVEPKAQIDSTTGPAEMTIQVRDAFGMRDGFGTVYRTNVVMPSEFKNENNGHWSLTCERLLSHGTYTATYEPQKNKLKLSGHDMKGKPQTTKCEVFTHDWRTR